MKRLCEGRIVVITGAGRGIGRAYALEFARQGARVVVNDLGGAPDGKGAADAPALSVVREIEQLGGQAVANTDDIADWAGARRLVHTALDTFGGLDVLVNNAGVLRDRTVVNMSEEEWDVIMRVHLKGTFAPLHHAAAYWRDEAKAGRQRQAAVINTSSSSGLFANPGQANYGAAKSGVATLSLIAAKELGRYGVSVNAIYPTALSRLTEETFRNHPPREGLDGLGPEAVAPAVVWLGSPAAAHVTGQVFGVRGNSITLAEGWRAGPVVSQATRWSIEEAGVAVNSLLQAADASSSANA